MWRRSIILSILPPMLPCSRSSSPGPIVRYRDIAPQLKERTHSLEAAASGASRFAVGLGKKVLVANVLAQLVSAYKASAEQTALYAWLYADRLHAPDLFRFLRLQRYGHRARAASSASRSRKTFAIRISPSSITEFWRRWHMSLGTWFRDYLYIPLGGSRCSRIRHILNIARRLDGRPACGTARRGILFSGDYSMRCCSWQRSSSSFRR